MTVWFDKAVSKWRYDFQRQGKRYIGYCRAADDTLVTSKTAARQAEFVEKRRVEIAPKMARAQDYTLAQAFADLLPTWRAQAHWTNKKRYIAELLKFFGDSMPVAAIGPARIADYVAFSRTQPVMLWTGGPSRDSTDPRFARFWKDTGRARGPSTVNLYLGALRQALERAVGVRDAITGAPALQYVPKVPELSVPKRKARPTPEDVLGELMRILPPHTVEALTLTLFFGFRRQEVFELQIHNVDFDACGIRLFAEDVKDNEDTFLPGGPEAMTYLERLVAQARERGSRSLITWRPYRKDQRHQAKIAWRAMKKSKGAWTRAMKTIEAKHGRRWRWHDIRAAFITHVARTSGQLAAQALARHSDYDTTRAYVEVADEFRRTAAHRAADRPALRTIKCGS